MEKIERSNNESYNKKMYNKNNNKIILMILIILMSFAFGLLVMYFLGNQNNAVIQTKYKDRVVSEMKVTTNN